MNSYKSIDEYIDNFSGETKNILTKIREIIHAIAPDAQETISYGMPAFKQNGKVVLYFAAFKNHIGLYPPVPEVFKQQVAQYAGPKGNLKFPLSEPIPYSLIKEIAKYKVENLK